MRLLNVLQLLFRTFELLNWLHYYLTLAFVAAVSSKS